MAKRHGVGFPVGNWRIVYGPFATSNGCPGSSTMNPVVDPWVAAGDHEHRGVAAALWAASDPFRRAYARWHGLPSDATCHVGGQQGGSPHGATARPFLEQAFALGKLGSPDAWDGQPNELEMDLVTISQGAYLHLLSLISFQPPAPPLPPVEPPVPPQPPGEPQPSDELERRVTEVEAVVLGQQRVLSSHETWISGPNTLNQHPDFVGLVAIFKRRVEALEIWRDDVARPNLQRALDRIADLDARLQALERGQPQPPPAPPPQPPPSGNEPAFTWKLDTPWTSTAAAPHRLLKVPFAGLARRITLSYRVDIPEVAAGQRQQVHAAYVDGSGRHGILSSLFVDGGRRSWVLRTNSAGASQPWVTATKAGLRPEEASAYAVRQDWVPGDNRVVAGSAGETTDRPLLALRMQQGLWVDLGYPATSVEGNPAEAYSIGWTWSQVEIRIWE